MVVTENLSLVTGKMIQETAVIAKTRRGKGATGNDRIMAGQNH
jgi:hypothetical protein